MQPDETYWRQPESGMPTGPVEAYPGPAAHHAYQGPPRMTPPPTGWQPPRVVEPPPPRRLPQQDHARIDAEEAQARTLTYGVGAVAGAIMLIVLCALCGRLLF